MAKVRLNIEIGQELAEALDMLASAEDVTRSEIVRRAITVLKTYKEQRDRGRPHLGCAKDPQGLDAELVGVLNSSAKTAPAAETRQPVESVVASIAQAPLPQLPKPLPRTQGSSSAPIEGFLSRWSPHAIAVNAK